MSTKKAAGKSNGNRLKEEIKTSNLPDIMNRNKKTQQHPTLMRLGLLVTIHNLDETTDQVRLSFPVWNTSMDLFETASFYISGWINHLTKYHLKISGFTVVYTTTTWNGNMSGGISQSHEIPLGKVFIPSWKLGKWMNPETVKKQETKVKGRKPIV